MTNTFDISETIPHINYEADGSQTIFCFPFLIFETGNITVYLDGEPVSSGYSVEFTPNVSGGNVIFTTAPANGTEVSLVRELTIQRISDFQEGSEIRTKVLNHEFNYQMACTQQIADALNRALIAPPYSGTQFSTALPIPSANKALIWNQDANALTNSIFDINEIENSFSTTLSNVNAKYENILSMHADVTSKASAVSADTAAVASDKAASAELLSQFQDSVRLPIHTILIKHGRHNIAGTELLDGHTISKDKYPQFWTDIVSFKQLAQNGNTAYNLYNYTNSDFNLDLSTDGYCFGFVINETDGLVRLPSAQTDRRSVYMVCANTVQDVSTENISAIHDELDLVRTGGNFANISVDNARQLPGNRLFICSPHIHTPELSSVLNYTHNLNLDTPEKLMSCDVHLYAACLEADLGYAQGEVCEPITQDIYHGSFSQPWVLQKNNLLLITSNAQWLVPSKDGSNPYWNSINGSTKWKFQPVIRY